MIPGVPGVIYCFESLKFNFRTVFVQYILSDLFLVIDVNFVSYGDDNKLYDSSNSIDIVGIRQPPPPPVLNH